MRSVVEVACEKSYGFVVEIGTVSVIDAIAYASSYLSSSSWIYYYCYHVCASWNVFAFPFGCYGCDYDDAYGLVNHCQTMKMRRCHCYCSCWRCLILKMGCDFAFVSPSCYSLISSCAHAHAHDPDPLARASCSD